VKRLLRTFVIEAAILYLVSLIAQGLVFGRGFISLAVTAAALAAATYLVKPVITVLILPLNLITFGLFRWVSHTIVLFLVDLVLSEFAVTGFSFGGLASDWLSLPAINLPAGVAAYVAFSLLISLASGILHWLAK
jgi:putative membrane protein